jgi:hypothetical protein
VLGSQVTGERAPPAAIENADTLLDPLLAVYRNRPVGSIATPSGNDELPVEQFELGEHTAGFSVPPAPTENVDTSLDPEFVT